MLNGAVVERVGSYKYLGFVLHATTGLTFGTTFLVAAARKAMFAMPQAVCTPGHQGSCSAMQAI